MVTVTIIRNDANTVVKYEVLSVEEPPLVQNNGLIKYHLV